MIVCGRPSWFPPLACEEVLDMDSGSHKKKLIEVALPLEIINSEAKREKSIRHGHPSTLHLWWARRPLAACRAVLFAQLVDDPSEYVDELLENESIRSRAIRRRKKHFCDLEKQGNKKDYNEKTKPTLKDIAIDIERQNLFSLIESLIKWENSTNEKILEKANEKIRKSCGDDIPVIYDPFSGGGTIPLEAQRLGLDAYGSDLNPVAVMIGKAMIEIPRKFSGLSPVNPRQDHNMKYKNSHGLARDIDYYSDWMLRTARERIEQYYPKVIDSKSGGGGRANRHSMGMGSYSSKSKSGLFTSKRANSVELSFVFKEGKGGFD